jgi:small subunit ribosomal protein S4e
MGTGGKKHLKRVAAPKSWVLNKLGGVFAPKPSSGPHKFRESLPLILFLRNKLKYALNGSETVKILNQRLVKVDGKVRTDHNFPAGFMDVITIQKTGEFFRLLYDVKGKFVVHRITAEEAKYKLCRVKKICSGKRGIPYCQTHDGRTIRYPDPALKVHDCIQYDITSGKITDILKFETGSLAMVTHGHNLGRVGLITAREKHPGTFGVVKIKDSLGNMFCTRLSNVFIIGKGNKPYISLPRGKGVRLTPTQQRDRKLAAKNAL